MTAEAHISHWEKIAGFVFGCVFIIALLTLAVFIPDPTPTQFAIFWTVLSLSAAGIAGVLIGFIKVESTVKAWSIKAGGAFAIFILIFFNSPSKPQEPSATNITGYTIEQHQKVLNEEKNRLRDDLKKLYRSETKSLTLEKQLLENQLAEVENRLFNIDQSYQERIQFLQDTIIQLRSFKGEVDDTLLLAAEKALQQGDTDKADQLFQQIEEQEQQSIERAAKAAFERGKIAEKNIKYAKAYKHFSRAAALVPDNSKYLGKSGDLAQVLAEYDKAIEYHQQALNSDLKTFGEGHPSVATRQNNLGTAWHAKGDYDKAIKFYQQALSSYLKTFGEGHPDVAITRNNLGSAWRAKGDYNKAIEYHQLALDSDLKTFGEGHPKVAIRRNNLGSALNAKGDYDKAIEYYQLALNSDLKTFGEGHPKVAKRHNNLGSAWSAKGDYDKASEYFQLALKSDLKTFGEGHPRVAITRNNLGSAWQDKGDYDKAIEYFQLALTGFEKSLGVNHPYYRLVQSRLNKLQSLVAEN